ncbi:hypothetical protein BURK1_02836 [Burkholderiales bacterium]|nr:hypothetical protein BURK1_02836 [Burkholderiales bacterium]
MTTGFDPSGNAVQRALSSLRHEGIVTFGLKLASEFGYRRVLLLGRPLDEPIPDVAPTLPIEIAVLNDGEIDDYLAFRPESGRASVSRQLASGWTCFVVRHENRIVSACWAPRPPYRSSYLECDMPVADGDAYLTDAWTLAAYRGRSIAHLLCLYQLRHYRALGYARALRGTVPENRSALRAHAKSGFRPIAMLGRVRLGPWRHHFRREWPDP